MLKHLDKWGTVCDDGFQEVDAQAACLTMGFAGMESFEVAYSTGYSDSSYPTNMDDIHCPSNATNFLECGHRKWGSDNCGHTEDILLTCK